MMDCSQFREFLAELDRPGVLPAEVREQAFIHAENCGDCGQLLTESESLDAEMRRLIVKDGHLRAAMRVESNLVKAFRERKAAGARESMRRFAVVIGVAAIVLLSVGFWLYRRTEAKTGSPVVTTTARAVPMEPKANAVNVRDHDSSRAVQQGRAGASLSHGEASQSARAASNGASQVASEDASEFIPLPDADYPVTLDDGAVVRVEMPRADLAAFGLPVEAMEGDGTVRADLIVSADGTPQAIRLVSQDDANATKQR